MADKKSMELIEQCSLVRKVVHKIGLYFSIAIPRRPQPNPPQDTLCIGVYHKGWFPGSVQDDGIGCLLPNAINAKQLSAKGRNIKGEESLQTAIIAIF